MQNIAEWLAELGMSEYAQRFAENRIDLSVLPDLSDQDLEKMGVILGDRGVKWRTSGGGCSDAHSSPCNSYCSTEADPRRRAACQR
jgi:SAM domain (Sterile alpha motif)